eukprot:CAMPEP_0204590512 /NCGR_PEP_ID=MMETSP0661-20131031/49831_1 /ASSEMBLY_ACC=CAM_ASM_000606 /TAXON_ID=109239 /ORGANISM="Alexandrium margalefi, Strain AMGDE01CS-322" /LENGTH=289 /DNA_ID=CAMNT_0051600547 /DNA_START=66 /DNA_END=935 /DNA_ORIENTATION=-
MAAALEEEPLLPRAGRSDLQPRATGAGCVRCLEDAVAFTVEEVEAHQRLLDLAAIPFDKESSPHEAALRTYWDAMIGGEYEAKSRRWREVGFQGDDPRTDFRGSGLLALKCLCFLAERHRDEARRWAEEAREGHGEMLFSAACINVCGLLIVQLHLNAGSLVAPVPTRPACNLALKSFVRQLPDAESEFEVFGDLFVAVVSKLCREWKAFCSRRPDANLMHFGDVLKLVNTSLECALATSKDARVALEDVDPSACTTGARSWLARARSGAIVGLLSILRCVCCLTGSPG